MKLGNLVAIIGCVGLGVGAVLSAPGCTATLTVGPCDGGCSFPSEDSGFSQDSALPVLDSSTPDATQPTDGSSPVFNACNSCLYGQCVSQYSNCIADNSSGGCLQIYQCATSPACAADGGNCVQDCYNAGSTTGKATYIALGTCDLGAQCSSGAVGGACGATCGTVAASCAIPDAGDDAATVDAGTDAGSCASCQAASCATQLAACATGTACATWNQCTALCQDATCDTACTTNNPTGAQAATALGTCTTTNCMAACQ